MLYSVLSFSYTRRSNYIIAPHAFLLIVLYYLCETMPYAVIYNIVLEGVTALLSPCILCFQFPLRELDFAVRNHSVCH